MDDTQTRRVFCCRALSAAAVAGALASVLESCGSAGNGPTGPSSLQTLPRLTASSSGGGITLAIDASSPLASVGSAALLQYEGGYLLLGRTSDSAFTALSAICTHQSCLITARAGQAYYCACHGSEFDSSGRVLAGPAFVPLAAYATQYDPTSNSLTIAV